MDRKYSAGPGKLGSTRDRFSPGYEDNPNPIPNPLSEMRCWMADLERVSRPSTDFKLSLRRS